MKLLIRIEDEKPWYYMLNAGLDPDPSWQLDVRMLGLFDHIELAVQALHAFVDALAVRSVDITVGEGDYTESVDPVDIQTQRNQVKANATQWLALNWGKFGRARHQETYLFPWDRWILHVHLMEA